MKITAEKEQQIQDLLSKVIADYAQRRETGESVEKIIREEEQGISNNEGVPEPSNTRAEQFDFNGQGVSDFEEKANTESSSDVGSQFEPQDTGVYNDTSTRHIEESSGSEPQNKAIQNNIKQSGSEFAEEEDEVSPQDKELFNSKDFAKELMNSIYMYKSMYGEKDVKKKINNERNNGKTPKQCSSKDLFIKNTTTFRGKPVEYKTFRHEVTWDDKFIHSFKLEDKVQNLYKLGDILIKDIEEIFGDLSRVTSMMVVSGMLIFNNIQYYPLCKNRDFLDNLPFDCVDYFKSGAIAELFNFGYLHYFPNLREIKIDSLDFLINKVAYDLEITDFDIRKVFKKISSLYVLEVGDLVFEAPGVDVTTKEVAKESYGGKSGKEVIEDRKSACEIYNQYINQNANAVTNWSFNNLKTYATNRGNKGFLRYSGGVLARLGMFGALGIGNLAQKVGGFTISKGVDLLVSAFKDEV